MNPLRKTLVRLLVVVVVFGLLGAVGVLLSQLNARTFTVEQQGSDLVVMKGKQLPTGTDPYHPNDASLAEAYAPLPLDGSPVDPGLAQEKFTDRDELDRALFDVIQKLATPRVTSDDPAALERGLYYLRRAQKLNGITPDQRQQLQKMLADVAYYQGRLKLDEGRKLIAEALTELHLAADSQNKHARSANQMLVEVEPQAKALEDSLRAAVNSLSAPPAATPPAPPPEPAPAAAAAPAPKPEAATPPTAKQ